MVNQGDLRQRFFLAASPPVSSAFGRTRVGLRSTKRISPTHARKNLWYPGSSLVNLVKYIQVHPDGNRINHVNPFQTGRELLRSPKKNKCFKNKFRYLFFHLKIFSLLLPDLRFDFHFLDMALRSVGRDLLLANLSGSGFLMNLVKYIQVYLDGNRIYHVKPFQTGRELLRSPKKNKCFKNKFRYLFFYLKIFALLLPDLRFDHHFLDMALKSVGWDLLLANLSGSGSLVYQAGEIQVHPDGNRIKHVKMK